MCCAYEIFHGRRFFVTKSIPNPTKYVKGGDRMEDQQIIELFWARSEIAVDEMERKYGSRALQFAGHFLGNHADVEECVNDALHALWERIPPERPIHLWAYFSRVLRNLCYSRLDHIHAAKRDQRHEICLSELEDCLQTGGEIEHILESKRITQAINTFLDSQDAVNRVIFVRRYYYFDSCQEIAKRLKMTRGAVNTRLSRLRSALRVMLEKEDISV